MQYVRVSAIPSPANAAASPDQPSGTAHMISNVRYYDGFLGQRLSPVACIAFHPERLVLAAGSVDGSVLLLAGEAYP